MRSCERVASFTWGSGAHCKRQGVQVYRAIIEGLCEMGELSNDVDCVPPANGSLVRTDKPDHREAAEISVVGG